MLLRPNDSLPRTKDGTTTNKYDSAWIGKERKKRERERRSMDLFFLEYEEKKKKKNEPPKQKFITSQRLCVCVCVRVPIIRDSSIPASRLFGDRKFAFRSKQQNINKN
jgi:hypothetical protein